VAQAADRFVEPDMRFYKMAPRGDYAAHAIALPEI
jgi:hypothetical protein